MKRLALTMATLSVFATAVSAGEILGGVAAVANDRVLSPTMSQLRFRRLSGRP